MLLSVFSEELLEKIVGFLAYKPQLRSPMAPPELTGNVVTPDLSSLSQVNHQLRRIALPFLFAYIHISAQVILDKFANGILLNPEYGKLVQMLILGTYNLDTQGVIKILPHLVQLFTVSLPYNIQNGSALIEALHHSPTVSSIILLGAFRVNQINTTLACPLSKVVLPILYFSGAGNTGANRQLDMLQQCVNRGISVNRIYGDPRKATLVANRFARQPIKGLFRIDLCPPSGTSLSNPYFTFGTSIVQALSSDFMEATLALLESHSTARIVSFGGLHWTQSQLSSCFPFLSTFLRNAEQQQTPHPALFHIDSFELKRPQGALIMGPQHVTFLALLFQGMESHHFFNLMSLVSSSFPALSHLDLSILPERTPLSFNVDEFILKFSAVQSVRFLSLRAFTKVLHFGGHSPWLSHTPLEEQRLAEIDWYGTRIALGIKTLDGVVMYERVDVSSSRYREFMVDPTNEGRKVSVRFTEWFVNFPSFPPPIVPSS